MHGIYEVAALAHRLGFTEADLKIAAEYQRDDIRELMLWPWNPHKRPRPVVSVSGLLRKVQCRLLRRLLKPTLTASAFSHGGVPDRHPLSNARVHFGNRFGFKMDVDDFYPSLNNDRVNRFFLRTVGCSPPVART